MPVNRVFSLVLDRREAQKVMDLVYGLYLSGALSRVWEVDFAQGIPSWPPRRLTVERAAKLLEILQERRKRTDGNGMSTWEALQALAGCDLHEAERKILSRMIENWKGYLQLDEFNEVSGMLKDHGIDFPPVTRVNYRMRRDELATVALQLRAHNRDQRRARKSAKAAPITPPKRQGRKGCGSDTRTLNAALLVLQNVMGLNDHETA